MVTMNRINPWIRLAGLFTAIALLLIWLTFANRAYIIENTLSLLLDREITIDDIVDLEFDNLFSATLRGVHLGHSDARFQAESMFIEINIRDWLAQVVSCTGNGHSNRNLADLAA